MKHLYYMRHGLSEGNIIGQWNGHDDTPLSAEGHKQAKAAGKKARDEGLVFDLIISSPSQRAHHTAQHVAKAVGYDHKNIHLHDDLKERNFGVLDGTNNTPEQMLLYKETETFIDDIEDSETLQQMHERAQRLLDYLKERPEETILIASHGTFGRALRRVLEGKPLTHRGDSFPNAEIFKLI